MLILPSPSEKKRVAAAIDVLTASGERTRNSRLCEWLITRAFLSGVRRFDEVNYEAGTVRYTWENQHDQLDFRNEETLRDYQIEMGRLLGIDIRPSATMKGWGLDRLRAASIAQVILDHEVDDAVLARIRVPFFEQLLQLGWSAVSASVTEGGALSGQSILEIVPPWEVLPIPYNAATPQQAIGIIRTRWVPLEWIRRHAAFGDKVNRTKGDLQVREIDWGEIEASAGAISPNSTGDWLSGGLSGMFVNAFRGAFASALGTGSDDKRMSDTKDGRRVVRVTELWLKTDEGLVRRYVCKIGSVILADDDLEAEGSNVYFPMGFSRYYGVGFYGRGFVEPLRHFALQAEGCLRKFFTTLKDMDELGILAIPSGLGIDDDAFKMDESPRKVYYDPDPLLPDRGINQIRPYNAGNMPTQGMAIATQYMQKLSGQSVLYQGGALGRVDSSVGMGMALETNNVGIEAVGNSVADAFTACYSAILSAAKGRLTQSVLLQSLTLDTNVVGIAMEPDGTVALDKNPIPLANEIKLNIKSRTPPSQTQQLSELRQNLQLGIITPMDFRLTVYRKGLPTEVANEGEYQSWRKIRLMVRVLFNDGKTPNVESIATDPASDNVEVCLQELQAFMATPEFSLATGDVKNAFVALRQTYEQMKGTFPEQLPSPDQMGQGQP